MSGNEAPVGRMYEDFKRVYEAEQVLSLKDILQLLKSYLWVFVLVVITCGGLAWGFSLMQTPMYQASAKVLVGQDYYELGALNSTLEGLQNLSHTMVETAQTRPVAEEVAQRIGASESAGAIQGNLKAEVVAKTSYFNISFEDPEPERAQLIANTAAEVMSERISEIAPGGESNPVHATVWQEATLPNDPVSPATKRNIGLALVLGMILGFGSVFLLAYLKRGWSSLGEVEEVSGTANLATIPAFKTQKNTKRRFSRRRVYDAMTLDYRSRRNGA